MKNLLFLLLLPLLFSTAFAQEKVDWKLDGQVQLRSELDGRDFTNKTYPYTYTYSRVRLGASASIDNAYFYFQAQDSRIFGEETSVSTNMKNLDLHQGYVKLTKVFALPLSVQAGRFLMSYSDERFFSASDWSYIAKAWDGIRVSYGTDWKVDVFALTRKDSTTYQSLADPAKYAYPAKSIYNASVYGVWFTGNLDKNNKLDAFVYHDVTRSKSSNLDYDSLRVTTAGVTHNGKYGAFSSLFDGAYQFGANNKRDVSAYLLSLQIFYQLDAAKLGIGTDINSGSSGSAKGKYYTFETPYNATHRFFGSMDYFYKTPSSKYPYGINDYYLTSSLPLTCAPLTFGLNYHHLMMNKQDELGNRTLGEEIDFTLKYDFNKSTAITWGASAFIPEDGMKEFSNTTKGPRLDTGYWSYLMITANF